MRRPRGHRGKKACILKSIKNVSWSHDLAFGDDAAKVQDGWRSSALIPAFAQIDKRKERHQEQDSPRRLAAAFTHKRDYSNPLYSNHPSPRLLSSHYCYTSEPKHKRLNTQRRREQRRDNQARYRTRTAWIYSRTPGWRRTASRRSSELVCEAPQLCYGVQTKNNIWHVVVEYFRLFRYGYLAPMSELNLATSSPNDASTPREPNLRDQEWFLRAAMSPDVAIGELSGVDALIEQWRRYSTYFGRLHFQLKGMEEQPFGALVATASLSFTHRNMLRRVFPHLLAVSSGKCWFGTEHGILRTRLLGRRLYCRCSVRFLWDDSTGRVTQLNCTMDLLTPLLRVFGSLEDMKSCPGESS
ncbi:hypothetical protein GQ600_19785 [Phytophthora cactorum]|nr:hypothetical protein GQ600_19785 [Phytophthora cactorum]